MPDVKITNLSVGELAAILASNGDIVDSVDLDTELTNRGFPRGAGGTIDLASFIAWTLKLDRINP